MADSRMMKRTNANSRKSSKKLKPDKERFGVLVVGEVGDGKSALVRKLTKPGCTAPVSGIGWRGITKDVKPYKAAFSFCEDGYIFDTPGVGDVDSTLPKVVASIETVLKNIPVHAVIVTCGLHKPRITMGGRVAAAVLKAGILDNDASAVNCVVVAGTCADLNPGIKDMWMDKVAKPGFRAMFDADVQIVFTSLAKSEDKIGKGEGEDDIEDLMNALQKIHAVHARSLNYTAPDSELFATVLGKVGGVDLATQEKVDEMKNNLDNERKDAEKRFQDMQKAHQKNMALLHNKMIAGEKAAKQQMQQFQERARKERQKMVNASAAERKRMMDRQAKTAADLKKSFDDKMEAMQEKLDKAHEEAPWRGGGMDPCCIL